MKLILSRKGFDYANGGYPSPIVMPEGRIISLPIPQDDERQYSELKLQDGKAYFDIMKSLNPQIKQYGNWEELTKETCCHLDPDIYESVIVRQTEWRAGFGQAGAALTHLTNEGVKENDLFLFFGLFREVIKEGDSYRFVSGSRPKHVMFGYLQVEEVLDSKEKVPYAMVSHPHVKYELSPTNVIYKAREKLSFNGKLPGAGVFRFDEDLVLTKKGFSCSRWDLPSIFREVYISFHSQNSWKEEGYFQSAYPGQEFVVEENEKVTEWAKKIINDNAKV